MKLNSLSEMAARISTKFQGDDIPFSKEKDYIGVPRMTRPGFRKTDKRLIHDAQPKVEQWLNKATEQYGIHWVMLYLEPTADMAHGQADWQRYKEYGDQEAAKELQTFTSDPQHQAIEGLEPPSDQNTIVFIKPTSRVHSLSPWQQIHNIGHGVWLNCTNHRDQFVAALKNTISKLQQNVYDSSGVAPSEAEVTVILGRLLDVQSFCRMFSLQHGDLNDPKKNLNTSIGSFNEAMFEMIAIFLRNGGKLPLKGRGPVAQSPGKVATPDRRGKMEPNQEVNSLGVRSWVWEPLAAGDDAWAEAARELEMIVVAALKACTWGVVGGPIYATVGELSTEP
jgi:hypothetical protein